MWELISRPEGTVEFRWESIAVDLQTVAARVTELIPRASRVRATLADYVAGVEAGTVSAGLDFVSGGREYFLGPHTGAVHVVVREGEVPPGDEPLPEDAVRGLGRTSHDGWQQWLYVPSSGRFHHNPHSWDWFYGDDADLVMVPVTTETFRLLARAGQGEPGPHQRATWLSWPSVAAADCAPEVLDEDGRPPIPLFGPVGTECPRCGLPAGVPLLYGFPTPEAEDAAQRGRVQLAGCVLPKEPHNRACQVCSVTWSEST